MNRPRIVAAGLLTAVLAVRGLPAQGPPPPAAPLPPAAPVNEGLTLNFPGGEVTMETFVMSAEKYAGKRFIFQDESVKSKKIFIYARTNPIPNEFYFPVFQEVLAMNKYALVPMPNPTGVGEPIAYKIVLTMEGTQHSSQVLSADEVAKLPFDQRWVCGVFRLKHINTNDIVPTLMNFVSNPKGIIPLPTAGMILVNDNGLNVKRVEQILKLMDVKGPDIQMRVIRLKFAIATSLEPQLSRIVQTIMRTRVRPPTPGGTPGSETLEIVADQRTNSLVVVAEQNRIDEIVRMIQQLDTGEVATQTSGIHIYRLRNTNAGPVADILNRVYQGSLGSQYGRYGYSGYGYGSYGYGAGYSPYATGYPATTGGYPGYPGGGYPGYPGGMGMQGMQGGEYPPTIVPDDQKNSIVVASSYYKFQELSKVIAKLDVKQAQVLLEVAFVEVSGNNTLDLGTELATIGGPGDQARGFAATNFNMSRLVDTNADGIPDARVPIPNQGALAGVFKDKIGNIPALLYTLEHEGKLNVLQVPTAVTSDNQIAELTVADERPTATITDTQTGNQNRTFAGFQKAGVTLKITPHISEERYLRLETEVSVEDFAGQSADPVIPPAKTSRKLDVAVSVPNAHTIMLGGLVKNAEREDINGIPLLKDIPLFGAVFSRRVTGTERSTLYVFITPHIFSDEEFHDFKRASGERLSDIERLTGRKVGVTTPDQGIPQFMPAFELSDPLRPAKQAP